MTQPNDEMTNKEKAVTGAGAGIGACALGCFFLWKPILIVLVILVLIKFLLD